MHIVTIRGIPRWIRVLVFLPSLLLPADELADLADWEVQWTELETRDDISSAERLNDQVELLREAGSSIGWRNSSLWQRARVTLDSLEASPDIEAARVAYLSLLEGIGQGLAGGGDPVPWEPVLREYFQRAQGIAPGPHEEGHLLYYLAESLLRPGRESAETRRRIEVFLQQAAELLPHGPPKDAVHLHLAGLYKGLAESPPELAPDGDSYLSRAVFHYRQVLDMERSRDALREQARQELDILLEPGLELRLANRFLPQSEIRIPVATRNLQEIQVEVYSIPWKEEQTPLSMGRLAAYYADPEPALDSMRINKVLKVPQRDRFDWQTTQLRLGEAFMGGWYWIRISAGDLSEAGLLLVTPLELTLIPRESGALTLWAVDAENGSPVPNALFHVFGESGELLASPVGDLSGLAEVVLDPDASWTEIHVTDGLNPGMLIYPEQAESRSLPPFLVPASVQVQSGSILEWAMPGGGDLNSESLSSDSKVILPSGMRLNAEISEFAPGVLKGRVSFPGDLSQSGPVYLSFPDGEEWLLTHLRGNDTLPMRLSFNGERIEDDRDIFLSSAPVEVRVFPGPALSEATPEFMRLRISRLERAFFRQKHAGDSESGEVLHERILRVSPAEQMSLYFELPEFQAEGKALPLKVEILSLESGQLFGQAIVALVPYRGSVDLRLSEQIVSEGDSVEISFSLPDALGSPGLSGEGDLIVYRERWESRYIHRKRGTLLTESEYLALPDRSLLGSAKTDYRLQESGFAKEAIKRIPVRPSEHRMIEVTLEQSGYYHLEFQSSDSDIRVNYPDGELEVWVLPRTGDLKALRSEEPRLIHELTQDGMEEILVLLDRSEAAVLLDLEFNDGRVVTEVLQPGSNALYRAYSANGDPGLSGCHAIVAGERETALLCRHFSSREKLQLDLLAEQTSGLNPGAAVNWPLEVQEGQLEGPALWGFYPESSGNVIGAWLTIQQEEHNLRLHENALNVFSLGQWLPLYDPLKRSVPESEVAPGPEIGKPDFRPIDMLALYPELSFKPDSTVRESVIHAVEPGSASGPLLIAADLPKEAGRWELMVFSPASRAEVDWQSWGLSTELPIRTSLDGPGVLRMGDSALIPLQIENTTRRQETLHIVLDASEGIDIGDRSRDVLVMSPGQKDDFPVRVSATSAGRGRLESNAQGAFSSSATDFECEVTSAGPEPVLKAFLVRPGQADWQQSIALQDWSSKKLVVSSGLGSALSEIWPVVREQQVMKEPLLAALGDWAFAHVRAHHGILTVAPGGIDSTILGELLQKHASGGGWSWTQGSPPDPWLSALVLWSLETFSGIAEDSFPAMREEASAYLEAILFDKSVAEDARLLALRALAIPAFSNPRIRPSRIQAKSFLEFLHRRGQLSNDELASLLQVARAFHFNEEVRLLLDELKLRYNSTKTVVSGGFWRSSLVYLALAEGTGEDALREAILKSEFDKLSKTGPTRSWEQFGGFLNLLAAFLWEGDFDIDGSASLSLNGGARINVALKPHGPNDGVFSLDLDDEDLKEGRLTLDLDTRDARYPVSVVIVGKQESVVDLQPFPEQSVLRYREYNEETLLSGSRLEITEVDEDTVFYPGDTLQIHLTLYVEEAAQFAELTFSVPAGAGLPKDSIQHSFEPSSPDLPFEMPTLSHMEPMEPLGQIVRMEPFAPGRHEFILSYRINWAGAYTFPESHLILPKSGKSYSLGESGVLEISQRAD